eukprot:2115893-Lingulodinium_polyedra.AAC.1
MQRATRNGAATPQHNTWHHHKCNASCIAAIAVRSRALYAMMRRFADTMMLSTSCRAVDAVTR